MSNEIPLLFGFTVNLRRNDAKLRGIGGESVQSGVTNLAAQWRGVALRSPPRASTSAPFSRRNLQERTWLLMAAQWRAVMFCGSRSETAAVGSFGGSGFRRA